MSQSYQLSKTVYFGAPCIMLHIGFTKV